MKEAGKGEINFKMIWLDTAFNLSPRSDSIFFSAHALGGDSMTVIFIKDKGGVYAQLLLDGTGAWDRDPSYVPVIHTENPHAAGQLQGFVGVYQGSGGLFLQIKEQGNQLILKKLWDNSEMLFVADSAMHFFCKKNTTFTLQFIKTGGEYLQMKFNDERWKRLKKPSISPAQWRGFEGTYRSKDDPDNLIRISAKDSSISVKQLWDGSDTLLKPLSDLFFCSSDQAFTVYFKKGQSGIVTGALVMNKNQFEKVKD